MSKREQYTAYSRTTNGLQVRIINDEKVDPMFRKQYYIYRWYSKKTNHFYIGHTNDFNKRKAEHLRDSKIKSNDLYVKMREIGIEHWEMQKLDCFYACNRAHAEETEQEWKNKLRPSLNMCEVTNTLDLD